MQKTPKGMKKGGKMKAVGGMRKPSAKNSGLFGRVKKMSQGGSTLSPAQQRMLSSAQGHAANTGQMPDELKRLTAQHGNLYAAQQQDMRDAKAAARRKRRQQRAPRRGIAPGMKGGGPIGGKKKK